MLPENILFLTKCKQTAATGLKSQLWDKVRRGPCGWWVLSVFLTVIITHSQAQLSTWESSIQNPAKPAVLFFFFLPWPGLAFERCTLICHFRRGILWCSSLLCFTVTNQTFQIERMAYRGGCLQLAANRLLTSYCRSRKVLSPKLPWRGKKLQVVKILFNIPQVKNLFSILHGQVLLAYKTKNSTLTWLFHTLPVPCVSQRILPHKYNFLTSLSHPMSLFFFYIALPLSSRLSLRVFPYSKEQLLMHLI